MGVFRRVGDALSRFMYGRNGMDQLNRALLWPYLAVVLLQAFFRESLLGIVCEVLLWALMLLIFFRMFSKDLYKRREENSRYLNKVWKLKNQRSGAKARHADKEHKYFTCKRCKAICRVPVGKGKIVITCPKCGAQIHAKT